MPASISDRDGQKLTTELLKLHSKNNIDCNQGIPEPQDAVTWQALFAMFDKHAPVLGLNLRKPPTQPTSCCGRGCHGCVWEAYFAAARAWRDDALKALIDAGQSNIPDLMNQSPHS